MPQRSNEFQSLVRIVRQHVAEGAQVTESAMVQNVVTGEAREVDVYIEQTVAGSPVVVSIECRDHKRKADVAWVEQMSAKHQYLPTNHLVLASRAGFTEQARVLAQHQRIELIDLSAEWSSEEVSRLLVGRPVEVWTKKSEFHPTEVIAAIESVTAGQRIALQPNTAIWGFRNGTLTMLLPVYSIVDAMVRDSRSATDTATPFSDLHTVSEVEYTSDLEHDCEEPLFIRVGDKGEPYRLKHLTVRGEIVHRSHHVPLAHSILGDLPTAHGRWQSEDGPMQMVATEQDRLRITIVPSDGKPLATDASKAGAT